MYLRHIHFKIKLHIFEDDVLVILKFKDLFGSYFYKIKSPFLSLIRILILIKTKKSIRNTYKLNRKSSF